MTDELKLRPKRLRLCQVSLFPVFVLFRKLSMVLPEPSSPSRIVQTEIANAVVGMEEVVEQLLITVLCRGHSLLEGFAGVGKWLAVQAVARTLGLDARKLRASSDLTLAEVLPAGSAADRSGQVASSSPAPLFGNFLYVDGIDRLPPKISSLLQQAMQERVAGPNRLALADPFVVFGSRLPDETPSPDAVIHDDRYLFKIRVAYPPYDEEYVAARSGIRAPLEQISQLITAERLRELSAGVEAIEAAPSVVHYAVRLVRATRVHEGENLDFVYEWVERGAGPRAATGLVTAAKARAILDGRSSTSHDDIRAIALPTLRHRIATNQNAAANGITVDRVIQRLLEDVPPRIEGDDVPPRPGQAFNFHNWTPIL